MTYEVKTPLALSCSYFLGAEKKYWGFNAELITLWQEMLPQEAFARLKVFDHQCLFVGKIKGKSDNIKANHTHGSAISVELQKGLKEILFQDLQKIEKEFDNVLVSAWLKIEPDRLLEIKSTAN